MYLLIVCSKPLQLAAHMNDSHWADEDIERIDGCYKLLIDAGSDLSSVLCEESNEYSWEVSALSAALDGDSLVSYLS